MNQNFKPQTFRASTSGEAAQLVRMALGDDALVLSNKSVNGQTEIIAVASEQFQKLANGISPSPAATVPPAPTTPPVAAPRATAPQVVSLSPRAEPSPDIEHSALLAELKAMRQTMEAQMAAMAFQQNNGDPGRRAVTKAMLNAGFSPLMARTLSGYTKLGTESEQALKWLQQGLKKHLPIAGTEMIDEGGIFALVGPTGVGKTTTTAKIAARCALRYGAKSFAFITTDTFRLAAEQQLQGYGKILGSPVHTVNSADDLKCTIEDLKGKRLILIDTVGMSQRDQRVPEQIAMLAKAGAVKRVLVLSCAISGAVLDDIASVYSNEAHGGLHGAILTKSDETLHLGAALDVLIRRKLPLLYVTTGQRVPEDIMLPDAGRLIAQAFAAGNSNAFSLSDADVAVGAA